MKATFFLLCLLFIAYTSNAQQDSTQSQQDRLYVGISFTTVSHHIYYKDFKGSKDITSGYFAPLALNIGYHLNNRASLQAGLAYGGSSDHSSWVPGARDTLLYTDYGKTHVLALPVTVRWIFLKAYKRFPIYGTATVMPAFGTTESKTIETRHGITSTTLHVRDSGVNVFFTAGFGFNYKISRRFNGFFEYHAFKHNLTGENSVFYDWDQGLTGFDKIYRSVGFGVNYDLKRKEQ